MKNYKHQDIIETNALDLANLSKPVRDKVKAFSRMQGKMGLMVEEDKVKLLKKLKALDNEIYQDLIDELDENLENNSKEIDDGELLEVKQEAYRLLSKLVPNLPKHLKDAEKEGYSENDELKVSYFYEGTGRGKHHIELYVFVSGYSKFQAELELEVDTKAKTAVAVNRKLGSAYQSEFGSGEKGLKNAGRDEKEYYWTVSLNSILKRLIEAGHKIKFDKEPATPAKAKPHGDEAILEKLWNTGKRSGLTRTFLKREGIKADLKKDTIGIGRYHLSRDAWFRVSFTLKRVPEYKV